MSSLCSRPGARKTRSRRRRPQMSSLCSRPAARRGRSRSRRSGGRCFKPGPIVRNPYLNFLRQFRKQNCGLSPIETIQEGAKEWKRLTQAEKLKFIKEAFYAPKRRRQASRAMCAPKRRVC
ncbi:uncharacterized protein ACRADG_001636 [Cochliomyia hominivorax]